MIHCIACHQSYPEDITPYICPSCGGVFDFTNLPEFDPAQISNEPGIWRYRHTFDLPKNAPINYLGEGDTPLVKSAAFGRDVYFKLEYLNPTGSFKDRGTAVLMSFLQSRSVTEAVEDSSGNAGASFSAYSASAGLQARIYVPAYASGPKRSQIAAYGATVESIPGPRSNAAEAVRQAAEQGAIYASHAYLPQGLPGFTTVAFELFSQLGCAPGAVVVPAGQGLLLLAIGRGFEMMKRAGLIETAPQLIGVQASACAPLWAAYTGGEAGLAKVTEGETLAEGVRIRHPHRSQALFEVIKSSAGRFITVDEDEIIPGKQELAQRGFYVEPTSAIVWGALKQISKSAPDPIVLILTGSGLKSG